MLGAIIGDIVGERYERKEMKASKAKSQIPVNERKKILNPEVDLFQEDSKFTDDTSMTVATADAILTKSDYALKYKNYGRRYPDAGYGGLFREWLKKDDFIPNNSFGNGTAMRVGPVGFAFNTIEEVLSEAKKSAEATHNHYEATKGAQAVATSIYLARKGYDKEYIKKYIMKNFGYNLNRTLDEIRPVYKFNATCQGSVPEAIIAFLESYNFESSIRKAISIGGDSDTIACITGSIAEAYYKEIPDRITQKALRYLDEDIIRVIDTFRMKYMQKNRIEKVWFLWKN